MPEEGEVYICDCCEEKRLTNNNWYRVQNETICGDCFDENYSSCDDCGSNELQDDMHWCEYTGVYVCESCYEDSYFWCESCDENYPNGHNCGCNATIQRYDYSPEYRVFDYRKDKSNNVSVVKDSVYQPKYNRKPTNFKRRSYNDQSVAVKSEVIDATYGVELEVEYKGDHYSNKTEHAQTIMDVADDSIASEFLFCMQDGSLEDGFEIGTMPFTERFYKQVLYRKRGFRDILSHLKSMDYRSYNTRNCGMHVHINRQSFSDTHLYKFQRFFYLNPGFIRFISRRRDSRMEQWCQVYGISKRDNIKAMYRKHTRKFLAVHLTNKKTVEVRIFRGTLSHKAFCRNMEFVFAVKEFTKLVSINEYTPYVTDVTKQRYKGDYTDFFIWLKNQDNRYPNLVHFLDNQKVYESWSRTDKKGIEHY
tara:strand:+ start:3608 stop:4867 length:1260 start_codon:yes stop_codon:yes gene_type:complete